jgi:hypothetical protein
MIGSGKKRLGIMVALLVFLAGMASPAGAATNAKTVQAYQGVKIIYNGQELKDSTPSYIINGTTYIPLRLLMSSFGKGVQWDAASSTVIISDSASAVQANSDVVMALQKQIDQLQSSIASLTSQINNLKGSSRTSTTSLSYIRSELNDYFADAGEDYLNDEGIDTSISLTGDEDDLYYVITLDCDDADYYDDITEISQSKLKSLMSAVKSRITSEADGTDYEDADITGKLVDGNRSSYYISYNGRSYTVSWDDEDVSLSDIRSELNDYFADAGEDYLGDSGIDTTIGLSGDEDDLYYTIILDFDYADYYDDVTEVSQTRLRNLMNAVKSRINSEIDNTDYEDADITGILYDDATSSYNVRYNGSSYTFSWD